MKGNMQKLLLSSCLLAGAMLVQGSADARLVSRSMAFNAPASCQGALPNYEGAIRKRPLALQNEGAATAFVTCNLQTQGQVTLIQVLASTHDGTSAAVSCTLVSGWKSGGAQLYLPKVVTVNASGSTSAVVWYPGDLTEGATYFPSAFIGFSCQLPPGTGLNAFEFVFSEDIGG